MKVEYLKEFLILSDKLNFSTAARICGISQPVLSTHIKSMESELGIPLFERDRHSVRLTSFGASVVPQATMIVHQYEIIERAANGYLQELSSKLDVGYLYYAYRGLLPNLSSKFSNLYPTVKLNLHSLEYQDGIRALQEGSLDITLTIDVDDRILERCNMLKLGEDDICCVVRVDDPLAQLDVVSLSELKDEPFILPDPNDSGAYAHFIEMLFEEAGFKPRAAVLYHEVDTRYFAVEAGEGIGLIGKHFQKHMSNNLKFIPLKEKRSRYNMIAIWDRANRNESIPRFLELAKAAHEGSK